MPRRSRPYTASSRPTRAPPAVPALPARTVGPYYVSLYTITNYDYL